MKPLIKDVGILLLILMFMTLIALMVHVFKSYDKKEYTYISNGLECKEYNKDSNTLLGCDARVLGFGEVEILNPVSVIKIKK